MKSLVVVLSIMVVTIVNGQTGTWLEVRPKAGFLVAHRSIMGHVATQHAFATEFSYYFSGDGTKYWHENYNKPHYGLSAFVGSVGNNELLGIYYGVYGFMSIPLVKFRNYEFAGRVGAGISYAPKVFDEETNVLSIGTSTHLNSMVSLGVENRIQFGNHAVNFIIDMTHFSNGASKVPNLGLNVPYISLGYGYKIAERDLKPVDSMRSFNKSWDLGVIGLVSSKEVYPVNGNKHLVLGLNAVARRFFKPAVGMEVTLDVMFKESLRTYAPDVPMTNSELVQLGLFTGYLLPFDRFHVVVGMGYYLRDKFKFQEPLYHRVGMRYVFDNGLNLNLVLKSHWARADYIEYGIGYTFKQ